MTSSSDPGTISAHPASATQRLSHDSPHERSIRSFVVRQGRMSEAQHRFLAEGLPLWGIPYQKTAIDLDTHFGRKAPRILEIGFGMGETTATIAENHPHQDYLGVEVHGPGVGSLLKQIALRELRNLRIIQHDAVEVVRDMLAPDSLDGIHIFFPDPWHKKKHNKRRLIQSEFVRLLTSRLKPGGYLHCATDWENYAQQMFDVLSADEQLQNTAANDSPCTPYAVKPDYRPQTKFETRGLHLGHGVWDLVFRRKIRPDSL